MLSEIIKELAYNSKSEYKYNKLTERINKILNKMSLLLEEPMGMMGDRLSGRNTNSSSNTRRSMSRELDHNSNNMPAPGQVAPGNNMEEIMAGMEQVVKQMDAAKRGMGLVNKLSDGPSRTKNRSRVMGNMNRIRANIRRIEKMLAGME